MEFDAACIAKLPKVELHCHLDGSLSLACLKQLAENDQMQLPSTDSEILEKMQAPERTRDLLEYLERFDYVLPFLQTYRNLELAAYDVVAQAAADNIRYLEVRFAPAQHAKKGLGLEKIVEAVIAGLSRAEEVFHLTANALICGLRQEDVKELGNLLPLFSRVQDAHLVGFDLAGDEINFPQKGFAPLIKQARKQGIHITLHAGECPNCEKNIVDSVAMGATRIGHGVMSKAIPDYWSTLIEKEIVLEMAPTSNFQTKAIKSRVEYPFKRLYDAGVHVTINTDNRSVSQTTLNKEYQKIADWYDFGLEDFEKTNHYAIDGAFIPEDEKRKLHQWLAKEYQELKK